MQPEAIANAITEATERPETRGSGWRKGRGTTSVILAAEESLLEWSLP